MPEEPDGPISESVYDQVSAATFSPYDPEAVQPTSSPAPSTQSGDVGDTSGADGEAGAVRAQDQGSDKEPPLEFDERYQLPFTGLIYLGALKKTFTLWGHQFVLHTLTTEEIAEAALLIKRYDGTMAWNAVYQAATLAAALVTIDDRPLPLPIVQGDSGLEARFNYVLRNLYPPVRNMLWQEYFRLESQVDEVLTAMGKVSG